MRCLTACVLLFAAALAAGADFRMAAEDAVILYDAPSAQSQKRFIVSQGYPLEVVVTLQGWLKVRDASGALLWVDAKKVSNKQRMVMVRAANAAVRQAADDAAPVVFQARENLLLEMAEGAAPGWVRVRHRDGASGFIRTAQLWGV
jgi:SH3-like domain-containing protein